MTISVHDVAVNEACASSFGKNDVSAADSLGNVV